MSTLPFEPAWFEAMIELARDGRHGEAVRRLVGALPGPNPPEGVRTGAVGALLRIARIAEAAGDLANAEEALLEGLRLAPAYADFHYHLACVRVATQRPAEARPALREALRIHPGYVAARIELALLDAREGRLGESLETLRRLGEGKRMEEPSLFRQGMESLQHADWEEAGALLKQALRAEDHELQAAIEEFHRRMAGADGRGAADAIRGALAGREGYPDLHYLLGLAELEESSLDDAVSSFARALELHPDYHAARLQMARALAGLGDRTQAVEQVQMVLEADPRHPLALELAGRWERRGARAESQRHRTERKRS